ncbi:hypothetical protein KLVA111870_01830 [Klebsiella variicola]|nr:hypothetical protein SB5387_01012 [Klebsiella variicola]
MKSGVPFNLLFEGMSDLVQHERLAMQIVLNEIESGMKYNWAIGDYEEVK